MITTHRERIFARLRLILSKGPTVVVKQSQVVFGQSLGRYCEFFALSVCNDQDLRLEFYQVSTLIYIGI